MEERLVDSELEDIQRSVESLTWYHTVDLGKGVVTPGFYDHRPYLRCYGLPKDLSNKTALDIGTASGFFAFEMERRGAKVVATDLPAWMAHDFGPLYQSDMNPEQAHEYLHDPFSLAQKALGSRVRRQLVNIYDIGPEATGCFDLVFCGSVLLHLTDPIRALWRIQSVTREAAIVATTIHPLKSSEPLALYIGQDRGDGWWLPNRAAFEAMVKSAGFKGWEWFSEFRLDFRTGEPGPYHAVIRAWNTLERPKLLENADRPATVGVEHVVVEEPEIQQLRDLVNTYEQMRYVRFVQWFQSRGRRVAAKIKQVAQNDY